MKSLALALCVMSASGGLFAQKRGWQPSPGHTQIPILPGTHFDKRLYPGLDAADKLSCRPDFAVALYPGHLWISKQGFELNPDIPVNRRDGPIW